MAPNPQPRPSDAAPSPAASSATDTVSVALKLPHGLILREQRKATRREAAMSANGWREFEIYEPTGRQHLVYGYLNHPAGTLLVEGFAITPGVPRDLWENWLDLNGDSDLIKNGLIKAHAKIDHVVGHAHDARKVRSGLEPIDPDNPSARLPKQRVERDGNRAEISIQKGTLRGTEAA